MQEITNYWPTIAISKILELVVLGMRIAVNESSVLNNRKSHDKRYLRSKSRFAAPRKK